MKNGKAPGPSGVTTDLIRMAGEPAVKELVKIGEHILKEEQSPEIWEESLTYIVFKGKLLDRQTSQITCLECCTMH